MDLIRLAVFGGMVPILDRKLLPEDKGQQVKNVLVGGGSLEPLRADVPTGVTLPADTEAAYLYRKDPDMWFSWSSDVDVLPSPIADDQYGRVYWTGDGPPKMTVADIATQTGARWPSASYLLGVPAPDGVMNITVADGAAENAIPIAVVYTVVYVSAYGEMGPASPPSVRAVRPDGHTVSITDIPVPSGNHNITAKRIYRSSGGNYALVAQIPAAQTSYDDTVLDKALGEALVSADWDMPNDQMRGLTLLPIGVCAGHFENVLAFSEPYLPHAWPTGHRLTTKAPIVGLHATAAGLVVLTEEQPYLCVGSSPAAMQLIEMDVKQPCMSKHSHVDMGAYSLYASPDGLVAAGGSDPRVVTAGIFSKRQWMAMKPETMRAFEYNGRYVVQYDGGGFVFNPATGDVCELDIDFDACAYDTARDKLYLIKNGAVSAFDSGAARNALFISKAFDMSDTSPLVAAKVEADGYPVQFSIVGDGETVFTKSVVDAKPFRCPAKRYSDVELHVQGAVKVTRVQASVAMGYLT